MTAAATSSVRAPHRPLTLGRALTARVTVIRALKVGLFVGTVLVLINQGDSLIRGELPPIWKILLTYCVPYCVSSYSTAMFMVELSRKGAPASGPVLENVGAQNV